MGKVKNKRQTSTVADVGVEFSRIQTRSQSRANSTLSTDISRDVEARRNTPSKKQEPETKMTPKEKYPQIKNKNLHELKTAKGKAKEQLKTPSGTSILTEKCLEFPSFKYYLKKEGVSLPQEKKERIRLIRKHRARWWRACSGVEKQRLREETRRRGARRRHEKPEEEYTANMKIQNEQKKIRPAKPKQSNSEKHEKILEKRREKRRQTFMETRREQNRLKSDKLSPEKHQHQLKFARLRYFQKAKNMTEEEKRLRTRFRRIEFLSKLSPEQIEARREQKNKLNRLNYQRMSPERKERLRQKDRENAAFNRYNPEWQLRRRLKNQFTTAKRNLQEKLVKEGLSYEEIVAAVNELKEKINSQRDIDSHTLNYPKRRSQQRSCKNKEKETLVQRDHQTEKSAPPTQSVSLRTEGISERDESTQVLGSTNTPDLSQNFNFYLAYSDVEPSPNYYLLDNTGLLQPVQTVEYVVEDDDTTGTDEKTMSISKRCSLCPAYFTEESQLQAHFSSVHSTSKTHWECTKCKEVLVSYEKLVEHSKTSLKCNPFISGQGTSSHRTERIVFHKWEECIGPSSGQVPEYKPAKEFHGIEEEKLTGDDLRRKLKIKTEEEKAEARRRAAEYSRKKAAAETPEERRRTLWLSRIKNAKCKLKMKLEKKGVPPEMIKIELDKLVEKKKNEPLPSLDSISKYKPKPNTRKPKT